MFTLRIIWMALRGLQTNLMRSLLATLGVIIGVCAVVSAMSILAGAKKNITERFESMGADQAMVVAGSSRSRRGVQARMDALQLEDAEAIRENCDLVKAVAPEIQLGAQIKYFEKNLGAQVLGTTESYTRINEYEVAEGRFITREDVRGERKVCVLGHQVGEDLFGAVSPIGYRVKINGLGFTVIGVMEEKGFLGFREVDSQVVIPITTAMKRVFGVRFVTMLTCQARDGDRLSAAIIQIKRALRMEHNIRAGADDDFTVYTQEQMKDQTAEVTKIFEVVLYSIAGISLLVGGIGIMNIMLVSVTERTREIGVRMAVGARRIDILSQFLIEATVISTIGGALGVLAGWGFSELLENITRVLETYTPRSAVVFALVMAAGVGIVSGLYPAIRASKLDPVESLRYE